MSDPKIKSDGYDPNLIPAETAARLEREQEAYKQTPDQSEGDIDTTGGYTVDKEGLVNNYAIEPEMYIEEPGDLRNQQELEKAKRAETLREINETGEEGKLTVESDDRGKGVGAI